MAYSCDEIAWSSVGVSKTCTNTLHPQSGSMVEQYIELVESHQGDWDAKLPFFLLAYRASTHDTMGWTPA
jgi:hypothetical protein